MENLLRHQKVLKYYEDHYRPIRFVALATDPANPAKICFNCFNEPS